MPFWGIYTPGHFGPWRTKCNQSLPMSSFRPVWVHCGCCWGLHRWWCCGHCPSSSAEGEGSMQKDGSWIWTSLESTNWVQSCFPVGARCTCHFLTCFTNDTQYTFNSGWIGEVTIGFAWGDFHSTFLLTRRLRGVSSRPFVGSVSAASVLCALRDRCDTCWRGVTDGWIIKKRCWSFGDTPEFCKAHYWKYSWVLFRLGFPEIRAC